MGYALSRGIDRFLFLGDYVGEFAYPERAMELCHDETGQWQWADLPEKYWDMALKELLNKKR